MNRRHFIAQSAIAGIAGPLAAPLAAAPARAPGEPPATPPPPAAADGAGQAFHRDFVSYRAGLEYFVLGNGLIQVVLQTAAHAGAGTHAGLFVMSPEHFSRKASSFLYHPERGAEHSRLYLTVDGRGCVPEFATSRATWTFPDGVPTVRLEWAAGGIVVVEEFTTPVGHAALVRTVRLRNTGAAPVTVFARALLYPNLMLFDEYAVERVKRELSARGFHTMHLTSAEATGCGDRNLDFAFGSLAPGAERTCTLVLSIADKPDRLVPGAAAVLHTASGAFWQRTTQLDPGDAMLAHLFQVAKSGLRAAVATSGKMDGGIWQYNLEWVRDQSMVATAAVMGGFVDPRTDDPAPRLLERMLVNSVDHEGGTVDSSRPRPPALMELDQNGALLHALWTHWVWTGDDQLIRRHFAKITAVGAYLQRPEFVDPDSGLLRNSREYWERDAFFGVREGFENSYQCWSIVGFEALADMTEQIGGDVSGARRWREAAQKMKTAYLSHPRHALVDQGVLIKRRLPDGTVQRTFDPPNRAALPPGMPLATERESLCNPDTSCVLPILHGIVDPQGPVARATLEAMETLWNQRWSGGGYGRYHVTSEPDSPGPWPLASMFVARANLEAGNHERVWRVLRWLAAVQGGQGGAWWEFYGARTTPPLPPVGLVVWTWAEIVLFFVHHLLGVRPQSRELVLAPHLLSGLDRIRAVVPIRGAPTTLVVQRTTGEPRAVVDGREFPASAGVFRLPIATTARTIVCHVR